MGLSKSVIVSTCTQILRQNCGSVITTRQHKPVQKILNGCPLSRLKFCSCTSCPCCVDCYSKVAFTHIYLVFFTLPHSAKQCHHFRQACYLAPNVCIVFFITQVLQKIGFNAISKIPYACALILSGFYSLNALFFCFDGDLEPELVNFGSFIDVIDPFLLFIILLSLKLSQRSLLSSLNKMIFLER